MKYRRNCSYCGNEFETNRPHQIYCSGYCAYYGRRFRGQYRLHGEIHQRWEPDTVDWNIAKKRKEDYLSKKMKIEKALDYYEKYHGDS